MALQQGKKKKKKKVKRKQLGNDAIQEQWKQLDNNNVFVEMVDSEVEEEERMQEWGAMDFKPKRNYEVPNG